jgi:hypothetical protein
MTPGSKVAAGSSITEVLKSTAEHNSEPLSSISHPYNPFPQDSSVFLIRIVGGGDPLGTSATNWPIDYEDR